MNRIIGLLAVVFIVVVVVSAFFIINFTQSIPTAQVTRNASASITITVIESLSITLDNGTLDFGGCAINLTKGYMVLDSSLNETQADNGRCSGGTYPDSLRLFNDGTVNVNVTAQFNESSFSFFNDTDSWFAYKAVATNGCNQDVGNYTNVTVQNKKYSVCNNFSFGGNNSIDLFLRTRINKSASNPGDMAINFAATFVES